MKVLKVIGKIFAVVFSIVYFFALTIFMFITLAYKFTSGTYYADVLEDINLDEVKLDDLGIYGNYNGLSSDDSVKEVIVKYFTEGGIDEKSANAIIENKEIKEVLGNFIGDYVNYNLGGEEPKISRLDVESVLKNPDVIKVTGEIPTEEKIDNIYNELETLVDELIKNGGVRNDNSNRNYENVINSKQ